jgi:hypothetical protein
MNLFFLDIDPQKSAEYHCDKHIVKMILETAQMLCTAHHLHGNGAAVPYKPTHINHPSAVWCRLGDSNYIWLAKLLMACCKEYTYRYGKVHKCEQTGLVQELFSKLPNNLPRQVNFTGPTPAMPDTCKVESDALSSYRNYYNLNKTHLASWKGKINSRNKPEWYIANI